MNKLQNYNQLIADFSKETDLGTGLVNPFQLIKSNPNNSNIKSYFQISPLSVWQHDLDAKILVLGQDWGPESEFLIRGKDDDDNGFVKRIEELFSSIGINIGLPSKPQEADLFFANVVLGLRKGENYSGKTNSDWIQPSKKYIVALIEIIEPEIIICLGNEAGKSFAKMNGLKFDSLTSMVKNSPFLVDGKKIFFVYHPSSRAVNRTLNQQIEDWQKIRKAL